MRKNFGICIIISTVLLMFSLTVAAEEGPQGQPFEGAPEMEGDDREFRGGPGDDENPGDFAGGPDGDKEDLGSSDDRMDGSPDSGPGRGQDGAQGGPQGGGMIDKSDDEELNALLAETEEKFTQIDYQDEETGMAFSYNLFVPDEYDENESYPLVLFITDSSVVGGDTKDALTQGYGAVVWASEEDQAKHPCFVLTPMYPENILEGEDGVTDYVPATLNLLTELEESYSIDSDRLYMTGQSMGCMTALYLNGTYPDLFAASLYVDGQWGTEILAPLEDQTFFYFAAEGDDKASEGMADVIAMFDADGASYAETVLNAKDSEEEINAGITSLLGEGSRANFVSWEAGSVLPEGTEGQMGSEHMYSFDHAYKISAVRDWLFEQTK